MTPGQIGRVVLAQSNVQLLVPVITSKCVLSCAGGGSVSQAAAAAQAYTQNGTAVAQAVAEVSLS
jgi:hypothetical protein